MFPFPLELSPPLLSWFEGIKYTPACSIVVILISSQRLIIYKKLQSHNAGMASLVLPPGLAAEKQQRSVPGGASLFDPLLLAAERHPE